MPTTRHRILTPKVIKEAEAHLAKTDRVMAKLVRAHGPCVLGKRGLTPYETLIRSIAGQQISVKAASTIIGRVHEVVGVWDADRVLATSDEALRGAGLSAAKVRYIRELSTRVSAGTLDFAKVRKASEADAIAALTDLPGIGVWTAEMFLIFGLRRADILSKGDGGLQRAKSNLYGEQTDFDTVAEPWRPYRSVACWYLWRSLDNT